MDAWKPNPDGEKKTTSGTGAVMAVMLLDTCAAHVLHVPTLGGTHTMGFCIFMYFHLQHFAEHVVTVT